MGRILVLDELTANKIAAGEVVERPASIVKELVENSIDAGSSRIDITIVDGGLAFISVTDNGSGMDAGDAVLAFERYATSKIKNADDLDAISSLGFRGEALPSIAVVSRINLKTRTKESVSGSLVTIEGGRITGSGETGCPVGTMIEVSDLFYNTPARKKHMKNPNTETGQVSDVVNKFALGYPNISFQLKSSGRLLLKTSGNGNLLDCIANVYSTETARDMLFIEDNYEANSISGYVGKPSLSRAGKQHQVVYINGRFVRNRAVTEAVEKAFHGMLMIGRHPVFVVNIRINPNEVDVNVHPAKTEVRLVRSGDLQEFITLAVAKALSAGRLIPTGVQRIGRMSGNVAETVQEAWKTTYRETSAVNQISESSAGRYGFGSTEIKTPGNNDNSDVFLDEVTPGEFPDLMPVGQIDCTYIVAQGSDGMYLIDQHAAHERVLYEKYMDKPEEFTVSEQLLFPVTLQLTYQEAETLNDNIITLTNLGFVIEHFGSETFLLRAMPVAVAQKGGREIFLDLLDYFSLNRRTISGKALKEKLLITMACKSAIKANHKLGLPEMEELISQLAKAHNPYTCPHGRPTLIHFSGYDLEKRFKRVL